MGGFIFAIHKGNPTHAKWYLACLTYPPGRTPAGVNTTFQVNTMRRLSLLPETGLDDRMGAHESDPVGGCETPIDPLRGFVIPAPRKREE